MRTLAPDMLKRTIKAAFAGIWVRRQSYWAQARRRRSMPVLCYHRVCDEPDPLGLAVSPGEFHWQMQSLADSPHLRAVAGDEYAAIWHGRRDYGARIPVLVSFDDGFRDNLTVAAPILGDLGIPAIVFVTTDVLQGRPPWYDLIERLITAGHERQLREVLAGTGLVSAPIAAAGAPAWVDALLELDGAAFAAAQAAIRALPLTLPLDDRYMSPPDLRAWLAQGLQVGAHTCTHPRLTALAPAEVERELVLSKSYLESVLGRPVPCFAYPFGRATDFAPAHARAVAEAGYEMAFTTVQGSNRAGGDPFQVRRKCVHRGLFTVAGGRMSQSLFLADLMGLGADLKSGLGRAPGATGDAGGVVR